MKCKIVQFMGGILDECISMPGTDDTLLIMSREKQRMRDTGCSLPTQPVVKVRESWSAHNFVLLCLGC